MAPLTPIIDVSPTVLSSLKFWTNLADGSILFPMGILVALVLLIFGQRRTAWAWTLAVGTVWVVILVLKVSGYAVEAIVENSPLTAIDLVTPSGHVASSTVIYGGLAGLLMQRPGSLLRRMVVPAVAIAASVGLTRIVLGDHSAAEVLIGACVGLGGVTALAAMAGTPVERRARFPLIAIAAVTMLAGYGEHISWERMIVRATHHAVSILRG